MFFKIGVAAVLGFLALAGYWYLNPQRVPSFLRWSGPYLEWPKTNSPMKNFRPPEF
jgi:hypothetical protein